MEKQGRRNKKLTKRINLIGKANVIDDEDLEIKVEIMVEKVDEQVMKVNNLEVFSGLIDFTANEIFVEIDEVMYVSVLHFNAEISV